MLHKKQPASVFIFEQPQPKLAVLTVSSTPPTGEYGKQKMHYLTELSVENKRPSNPDPDPNPSRSTNSNP